MTGSPIGEFPNAAEAHAEDFGGCSRAFAVSGYDHHCGRADCLLSACGVLMGVASARNWAGLARKGEWRASCTRPTVIFLRCGSGLLRHLRSRHLGGLLVRNDVRPHALSATESRLGIGDLDVSPRARHHLPGIVVRGTRSDEAVFARDSSRPRADGIGGGDRRVRGMLGAQPNST